jgi:LPS export ABC transporter protein LptC
VKRLLSISILALLLLAACDDEQESGPTVTIPPDAPDEESWNTTLLLADSNWTKARVQFGHARKYIDRMETLLDSGVYVEFFDVNGGLNATLVADSARIDDRTRDMTGYGNVFAYSPRERTSVRTQILNYSNEKQWLSSTVPVTVHDSTRGNYWTGIQGFESDISLKRYTFKKTTGTFRGQ